MPLLFVHFLKQLLILLTTKIIIRQVIIITIVINITIISEKCIKFFYSQIVNKQEPLLFIYHLFGTVYEPTDSGPLASCLTPLL